jgi:FeS assembly SUF system protein
MNPTKPQRIPLEMDQPSSHQHESSASSSTPTPPIAAKPPGEPLSPGQVQDIEDKVAAALKTCFDPEIPVNIHELGLIYGVQVDAAGAVLVRMTLTSPACPAAGSLPPEVQAKVSSIPGVSEAKVEVVWDPPWTPERMSDAAKLQLGMF